MQQSNDAPTFLTLDLNLSPENCSQFREWQAKLNATITGFQGFISLEILCPVENSNEWVIVQRFVDSDSLTSWKNSKIFQVLIEELTSFDTRHQIRESIQSSSSVGKSVTEVLITEVQKDKELPYMKWSAKIHEIEAKFPGFRGVFIQSPKHFKGRNWITLLHFDSAENLDKWLLSEERHNLLKESDTLISSLENHRIISPYGGWFSSIAKNGKMPSVWKQTMVVLLVLFPVVMLEIKFLSPLTAKFSTSLSTFIGNAISVSLLAFPLMPIAIHGLKWWLESSKKNISFYGAALVLLLYLFEIILFSYI